MLNKIKKIANGLMLAKVMKVCVIKKGTITLLWCDIHIAVLNNRNYEEKILLFRY